MASGCTPTAACAVGQAGITATLYFGRTVHDGGMIDAAAWDDFLARSVTPRFPDGLTVLDGRGQWLQRATGRVVAQPSTVIVIATDASAGTLARLEAIRSEYRSRFGQESVGLVTTPGCASF